jgi:hypothetical protein
MTAVNTTSRCAIRNPQHEAVPTRLHRRTATRPTAVGTGCAAGMTSVDMLASRM